MNLIGVDLGAKHIGIANSQGQLASPYATLKVKNLKSSVLQVSQIADKLMATKIIVGFVDGKTKSYHQKFAKELEKAHVNSEVILWDETLTSRQAQELQIKLQVPQKKRQKKEHETAAAIILQSYIDTEC